MPKAGKLQKALFSLRISVFLVFFVWTLDKLVRPEHASEVFKSFYFLPELGHGLMYVIGGVQMLIIFAFLLGIKKKVTYGLLLVFHFISTVSCFKQYFAPFESMHLLFFAAWPMLAACLTLYWMREEDTLWSLNK